MAAKNSRLKVIDVSFQISGKLDVLPSIGCLLYCRNDDWQQLQQLIPELGSVILVLLHVLRQVKSVSPGANKCGEIKDLPRRW